MNPVSTLLAVLYQATEGADWQQLGELLAQQLGIEEGAWALTSGNPVQVGAYGGASCLA